MAEIVNQYEVRQNHLPLVTEESVISDNQTVDGLNSSQSPNSMWSWVKKHKFKLIVGVAATSAAVTLINDPFEETKKDIEEAAPWVAAGVVASEIAFVAGAGMMITSVGDKVGNPLTLKKRTKEIAAKANSSNLFKTGFAVNTAGAVGDFAVISTGVMKELPPSSWGILSLTLADLGLTVAVRKGILNSIHNNSTEEVPSLVE
jgi:uncharacterized membrane protein YbhN (UPF0104 family)